MAVSEKNVPESTMKPTEIEFEGKWYTFTKRGILLFVVGTPLISLLVYFGSYYFYWRFIHLNVAGQTAWILERLFNEPFEVELYAYWAKYYILVPGRDPIGFTHYCSGFQATAIFVGVILCTPHPVDPAGTYNFSYREIQWEIKKGHQNIWIRKLKSLALSAIMFHIVNIIRMIIQLGLYYNGYAWADIHYSISAASSFIAAVIVLLMHRWLPEFVFAIIFIGAELKKSRNKKKVAEASNTETSDRDISEVEPVAAVSLKKEPDTPPIKDKAYWDKFWALYYLHIQKKEVDVEDKDFRHFVNDRKTPLMVETTPGNSLRKSPYFLPCFHCGVPVSLEKATFSIEKGVYCPSCAESIQELSREDKQTIKRKTQLFLVRNSMLYLFALGLIFAVAICLFLVSLEYTSFEANFEISIIAGVLTLCSIAAYLGPNALTKRMAKYQVSQYLQQIKESK